jgi:hypothetical protein
MRLLERGKILVTKLKKEKNVNWCGLTTQAKRPQHSPLIKSLSMLNVIEKNI